MLPLQQPFGQELALHTHCPLPVLQVCPVEHVAHFAPPVPHEPNDSDAYASHVPVVPPLQQPFAHVVPSHEQAPLVVSQRPLVQAAHAAPPAPHWLADCAAYATHAPAAVQRPPGHDVASHTHWPAPLHSWVDAQAAQVAPPVPQEPLDSDA